MVKVPNDYTIKFLLSMLAALNGSSSHVSGSISIQPLLAKHCKEGREEGNGKACIEDRLDLHNWVWRASPLRNIGGVITKGGVVNFVDQDTEESSSLIIWVRLELRLDINDECRGDSREQTSLWKVNTGMHKYHVKLTKIRVVFKSSSCFFMNSLSYSSASLR